MTGGAVDAVVIRELGMAIAMAMAGGVLVAVKNRRDKRRDRQTVGQTSTILPLGEFAAWPMRGPLNSSKPWRLVFSGGVISLTAPGRVQPEWQAHAGRLGVSVLRPTSWGLGFTRLRLTPPGHKAVTVRVSRETRTPMGGFDQAYENRLEGYTRSCIDLLRRSGAEVG